MSREYGMGESAGTPSFPSTPALGMPCDVQHSAKDKPQSQILFSAGGVSMLSSPILLKSPENHSPHGQAGPASPHCFCG